MTGFRGRSASFIESCACFPPLSTPHTHTYTLTLTPSALPPPCSRLCAPLEHRASHTQLPFSEAGPVPALLPPFLGSPQQLPGPGSLVTLDGKAGARELRGRL